MRNQAAFLPGAPPLARLLTLTADEGSYQAFRPLALDMVRTSLSCGRDSAKKCQTGSRYTRIG